MCLAPLFSYLVQNSALQVGLDSQEASEELGFGSVITKYLVQALCSSEGGRPESSAELSVSREQWELLLPNVRKRE